MNPKFKNVRVQLIGMDGNAFSILARVIRAMKKEKCSSEEIKTYEKEATSGDYNHLLRVTMETVHTY